MQFFPNDLVLYLLNQILEVFPIILKVCFEYFQFNMNKKITNNLVKNTVCYAITSIGAHTINFGGRVSIKTNTNITFLKNYLIDITY